MQSPAPAAASPRRALVTGASAGIGAEFARQLAARGHALTLVARRADRLAAMAAQLHETHGVDADWIVADLDQPDAVARLCDELGRRGHAIDVLVNNAGYGVTGTLLAQPWSVHAGQMQCMVSAPVDLCYRLLPGMRARGFGRIINVASLAGLVPAPAGHTLYAPVKAFLIKFSQALALENAAHGVHVTALCPGFTRSEFHDVNGTRDTVSQRMPAFLWMDAPAVVRQGLDANERGVVVFTNGTINRLIKGFFKLLPDGIALRLLARQGRKFRVVDEPAAPG